MENSLELFENALDKMKEFSSESLCAFSANMLSTVNAICYTSGDFLLIITNSSVNYYDVNTQLYTNLHIKDQLSSVAIAGSSAIVAGLGKLYFIELPSLEIEKIIKNSHDTVFLAVSIDLKWIFQGTTECVLKIPISMPNQSQIIINNSFNFYVIFEQKILLCNKIGDLEMYNYDGVMLNRYKIAGDSLGIGLFEFDIIFIIYEKSIQIYSLADSKLLQTISCDYEITAFCNSIESGIILGQGENIIFLNTNLWNVHEINISVDTITHIVEITNKRLIAIDSKGKIWSIRIPDIYLTKQLDLKLNLQDFSIDSDFFLVQNKERNILSIHQLKGNKVKIMTKKIVELKFAMFISLDYILVSSHQYTLMMNITTNDNFELNLIISYAVLSENNRWFAIGDTQGISQVFSSDNIEHKFRTIQSTHIGKISCLIFIEDDTMLVTASDDGYVKFWKIDSKGAIFNSVKNSNYKNVTCITCIKAKGFILIGSENPGLFLYDYIHKVFAGKIENQVGCPIFLYSNDDHFISINSEYTISFWSSKNFVMFFEKSNKALERIRISRDGKLIGLNLQNEKDYIIENPLFSLKEAFISSVPINHTLLHVRSIFNSKKLDSVKNCSDFLFLPYRINSNHLHSYYNNAELKESLLSAPFIDTKYGAIYGPSPFSLSIEKKNKKGLSILVKHISKEIEKNPHILSQFKHEELIKFNDTGFDCLTLFYEIIFRELIYHNLDKKCSEFVSLPKFELSTSMFPTGLQIQKAQKKISSIKPLKYFRSIIPLALSNGSAQSLELLHSLSRCSNKNVLTSPFISNLLEWKWKQLRIFMDVQLVIYTAYLSLICAIVFVTDIRLEAVAFLLNIFLFLYETLQMIMLRNEYFSDIWNFVDVARSIVNTYAFSMSVSDNYSSRYFTVLSLLLAIVWIRGVSYFRLFKQTRYMVNLLIEVGKDAMSFMILLFYTTLAFSFMLYALNPGSTSYGNWLLYSFLIDAGQYLDLTNITSSTTFVMCINIFIDNIIMINLFISIMGDTQNRVIDGLELAENIELLDMVIEMEGVRFWKRKQTQLSHFHLITSDKIRNNELHGTIEYLSLATERIEINQELINNELKKIKKDIKIEIEKEIKAMKKEIMDEFNIIEGIS